MAQVSLLTVTGIPECLCSESQNKSMADALARVSRHFPSVLTQKQQDIAGAIFAVGAVAFAQASAYQKRVSEERKAKRETQSAGVVPFMHHPPVTQ